jgi:hypothetical protein
VSAQARAAGRLADHLATTAGLPVVLGWDNPSGRPGDGRWRVEWTDGPTTATMRTLTAQHARWVPPLDITVLRYSRQYTPTAWAAALIAMAGRGELPDTPGQAVALVEYDLHDTDASDWAPHWPAALDLAHRGQLRPAFIAEALIAAGVTKPRHETDPHRCRHCGDVLPEPANVGRPRRWCSPACRQAARRQTSPVTKPRHETSCNACGEPITPSNTGRPRRWCSPTCRTRGWRTRGGAH